MDLPATKTWYGEKCLAQILQQVAINVQGLKNICRLRDYDFSILPFKLAGVAYKP